VIHCTTFRAAHFLNRPKQIAWSHWILGEPPSQPYAHDQVLMTTYATAYMHAALTDTEAAVKTLMERFQHR